MKKFNPKLIMIDVDGTLVDSVPDLAYCVDELMVLMGREMGRSQGSSLGG